MMWPAQGHEPSYRTINRFRVHPAVFPILKAAFVAFRCHLVETGEIDEEAILIDGTKIEANANRYTFVWRKAVEKYNAALVEKSNQMYDELMADRVIPEIERESPDALMVQELEQIAAQLEETIESVNDEITSTTDVEELKANLGFTCFFVRGKQRVKRELGFALMAVNIRKFMATGIRESAKKGSGHRKSVTEPLFLLKSFKTD